MSEVQESILGQGEKDEAMTDKYFQSDEHFKNYIIKIVRENRETININSCVNINYIVEKVYREKNGLISSFTWELKNNPSVIEEDKFWDWYSKMTQIDGISDFETIVEINPSASKFLKQYENKPGVYCFSTKSGKPIYIGMSKNLWSRVHSSFKERFENYNKKIYLKICSCENASDAAILEVYFINKYNPPLNGTSKYPDDISFKLENIPGWTKPILFNLIEG